MSSQLTIKQIKVCERKTIIKDMFESGCGSLFYLIVISLQYKSFLINLPDPPTWYRRTYKKLSPLKKFGQGH